MFATLTMAYVFLRGNNQETINRLAVSGKIKLHNDCKDSSSATMLTFFAISRHNRTVDFQVSLVIRVVFPLAV